MHNNLALYLLFRHNQEVHEAMDPESKELCINSFLLEPLVVITLALFTSAVEYTSVMLST